MKGNNYYCVIFQILMNGTNLAGANTRFVEGEFNIQTLMEEEKKDFQKLTGVEQIEATPVSVSVITKELFDAQKESISVCSKI